MTNIIIESSTLVPPKTLTPAKKICISNLDRVQDAGGYLPLVYFYKSNGSANFLSADILSEALSAALVPYYPLAGRLQSDGYGRPEIDCCGAGVLFVKASAATTMDNYLDDSTHHPQIWELAFPRVDYAQNPSTWPLAAFQVTFFQCGGVAIGVASNHQIADGLGWVQFINTWAALARGETPKVQPSFDRTVLNARSPPTLMFPHVEFQAPPRFKEEEICENETKNIFQGLAKFFHFSKEKLEELKVQDHDMSVETKYTSFETLAAHVWKCYCEAYNFSADQETMMTIAVDGRTRLRPPPPDVYCGNVVLWATPRLIAEEIMEKPLYSTAKAIHDAIARMDNEYLRSAIDYLELEPTKKAPPLGCPNPFLVSWVKLPLYDADCGWGQPVFVTPAFVLEGHLTLLPSPKNDGSLSLLVRMRADRMLIFDRLLTL